MESAWNNQEASVTEVSEGEEKVGDNIKEVRDGVEANLLGLGRPLEGLGLWVAMECFVEARNDNSITYAIKIQIILATALKIDYRWG